MAVLTQLNGKLKTMNLSISQISQISAQAVATSVYSPAMSDRLEPSIQEIGSDWYNLKQSLFNKAFCAASEKSKFRLDIIRQLLRFHETLRETPNFIYSMHIACSGELNDTPWNWQLLEQDGIMEIGLLTIYGDIATPLHDHPGQSGAILTLTGSTGITQFDTVSSDISADYPIAKLHVTNSGVQSEGKVSFYEPNHNNIHEYQACSERCVLLVAAIQCEPPTDRSQYFPISPRIDSNTDFFAQRLKRHW